MFRLEYTIGSPNTNIYMIGNVFGDYKSIFHLWFYLRENLACKVFCGITNLEVDMTRGLAEMISQSVPAFYGGF